MNAPFNDLIERTAATWATRLETESLTESDAATLVAWLMADVRHVNAFARARAALVDTAHMSTSVGPEAIDGVPPPACVSRRGFIVMALSASVLIGTIGIAHFFGSAQQHYRTRRGEWGSVVLPDGSRMLLNTATEVEVAFNEATRHVNLLAGEAIFEVAQDDTRIFIVEANGMRAETLGTSSVGRYTDSAWIRGLVDYAMDVAQPLTNKRRHAPGQTRGATFIVRRWNDLFETITLDGIVEVRGQHRLLSTAASLAPSMALKVRRGDLRESASINETKVACKLAWLENRLCFFDVTTGEAVEEFNRHNDVQIVVDESIAQRIVRGLFRADDPVSFATALALQSEARVEVRGGIVWVNIQAGPPSKKESSM